MEPLVELVTALPGLSHAILALAIMAATLLALAPWRVRNAHWIGAALGIGFYWGREKRDHENRLRLPAEEVWDRGWLPLEWSAKGQADFYWPLVACLLAALAIELLRRR